MITTTMCDQYKFTFLKKAKKDAVYVFLENLNIQPN